MTEILSPEAFGETIRRRLELASARSDATLESLGIDSIVVTELLFVLEDLIGSPLSLSDSESLLRGSTTVGSIYQFYIQCRISGAPNERSGRP